MEGSYLSRIGSSSSTRQVTSDDIFSKSSREEDDEETLKWAAFERLPTYNRLKIGMLSSSSKRGAIEVDIQNLGFQERQHLLHKLLGKEEEDNQEFL